jgi:hypothetical protein
MSEGTERLYRILIRCAKMLIKLLEEELNNKRVPT